MRDFTSMQTRLSLCKYKYVYLKAPFQLLIQFNVKIHRQFDTPHSQFRKSGVNQGGQGGAQLPMW